MQRPIGLRVLGHKTPKREWRHPRAVRLPKEYRFDRDEMEFDPKGPRRHVANPADVVALIQLATADGEVALRACYPHQTLAPKLEALAEIGRRSDL